MRWQSRVTRSRALAAASRAGSLSGGPTRARRSARALWGSVELKVKEPQHLSPTAWTCLPLDGPYFVGHRGDRSDGELGEVRGSGWGGLGAGKYQGMSGGLGVGGLCGMAGSLGDGVGRKGSVLLLSG